MLKTLVYGFATGAAVVVFIVNYRTDQPQGQWYNVMPFCKAASQVHFADGRATVADWGVKENGHGWCRLHAFKGNVEVGAVASLRLVGHDAEGDLWADDRIQDCQTAACKAELTGLR